MAQRNAQIETMQKELQRRETHKKEQKTALLMAVREVAEQKTALLMAVREVTELAGVLRLKDIEATIERIYPERNHYQKSACDVIICLFLPAILGSDYGAAARNICWERGWKEGKPSCVGTTTLAAMHAALLICMPDSDIPCCSLALRQDILRDPLTRQFMEKDERGRAMLSALF